MGAPKRNQLTIASNLITAKKRPLSASNSQYNSSHSSTNSQEIQHTDNEWIYPKKAAKLHKSTNPQFGLTNITNKFATFNDKEINTEIDDLAINLSNSSNVKDTPSSSLHNTAAHKQDKLGKPPPIHVCNSTLEKIVVLLKNNNFVKNTLTVKQNDIDKCSISATTLDIFSKIVNILKINEFKFYTYTPKNKKL